MIRPQKVEDMLEWLASHDRYAYDSLNGYISELEHYIDELEKDFDEVDGNRI